MDPKKFWVQKNVVPKKILGVKKLFGPNTVGSKNFWVKKTLRLKKSKGQKKIWVQKIVP